MIGLGPIVHLNNLTRNSSKYLGLIMSTDLWSKHKSNKINIDQLLIYPDIGGVEKHLGLPFDFKIQQPLKTIVSFEEGN